MRLVTIGGYGFDEARFLDALRRAGVDTFVDVRQRRGMRGRQYAFLNSARLQASVARAGMRYLHLRELAPPSSIRDIQRRVDASGGDGKRGRHSLTAEFVRAYEAQVLDRFDSSAFEIAVGSEARVVALFCVEGHPGACHRSLAAARIARQMGADLQHLLP